MGKSVSAPATPDYAGAATAQGAANVEAARASAKLSNPNIYGPLGTQTVTYGTPSFDQTAYDKAMADFQANQGRSADRPDIGKFTTQRTNDDGNVVGQDIDQQGYQNALMDWLNTSGKAPTREQYTTTADADTPTIRQTLTPEAQATLDAQQRVQKALAGLGEQGIGTAQSVLGQAFNPNLPGIQTSLGNYGQVAQTPDLSQYGQAGNAPQAGQLAETPDLSQYGQAGGGPQAGMYGFAGGGPRAGQYGLAQGALNTANIAAMPVNAGTTGQQAILSRLAPQIERSQEATRQRLANQGLVPGTQAYQTAMIEENQRGNDLYTQAALQGLNLDIGANAQGFGQALQSGQFGNQAVAQNFGQGQAAQQMRNAAMAQNFGQGVTSQQLGNQSVLQNQQAGLAQQQADMARQQQLFGQGVTSTQLGNQAISQNQQAALAQQQAQNAAQLQQYNQALGGAQFGNTAQQQSLAQQMALRNQPLNEITGLMSGSQIQMPQFQGYQGQSIAPAPIFAGAQAAGQNAMQNYGIQQSAANAQTSGLFGLAGAGLGAAGAAGGFGSLLAMSDRRLKSNIVRVGDHPLGIGVYEYDIFGGRQRGVMADEVEKVMPDAVLEHPSGYKMVNYGKLL